MKDKNLQHYQLPNKMTVSATDQYIYLILRSHYNGTTRLCFPSLNTISKESGLSIPTVRKCIDNLKNAKYIAVVKNNRKNYYLFTGHKKFEPFSPEFLKNPEVSPTTKAYLIATQQHMFKEVENIGAISYSNRDLSKITGIPEATIRKCNKELKSLEALDIVKNKNTDKETGCKTETKLFKMDKLHQEIIWRLKEHEERLNEHDAKIDSIEKSVKKNSSELAEYKKLVKKLISQLEEERKERQLEKQLQIIF